MQVYKHNSNNFVVTFVPIFQKTVLVQLTGAIDSIAADHYFLPILWHHNAPFLPSHRFANALLYPFKAVNAEYNQKQIRI
jgi:hypothetical protein